MLTVLLDWKDFIYETESNLIAASLPFKIIFISNGLSNFVPKNCAATANWLRGCSLI